LVGFDGQPAALPEEEMEALRKGLTHQLRVEPHPYLTVGRRVRIRSGPLKGMEGILIRRKGVLRVILSVNLIKCSTSIEVDSWEIEPVPQARSQTQNACETPH
jgi:transcription antitermination factor NusG